MFLNLGCIVLEAMLMLSCFVGDYLLEYPVIHSRLVIAAGDSLTHGIVGALSWAIVCDFKFSKQKILECCICALLAMIVDVDHFLAAKSFHLKEALSLTKRPPFHATTVIIVIDLVLITFSLIIDNKLVFGAFIFTTAWFSHHVRDGHRRGLWFYPFGETSPIPLFGYLATIFVFPLLTRIAYFQFYKQLKDKVIELDNVMVL